MSGDIALRFSARVPGAFLLQFRAGAFNFANTPTFEEPGRVLNSATFGVVTSHALNPQPREVQLALRLSF